MRDDGYNYLEDNKLPKGSKPVWIESDMGCGIGFLKKGRWYWNKRNLANQFIPVTGKVTCWKYMETRKKNNKTEGEENGTSNRQEV